MLAHTALAKSGFSAPQTVLWLTQMFVLRINICVKSPTFASAKTLLLFVTTLTQIKANFRNEI